jgi:hypothetical protein
MLQESIDHGTLPESFSARNNEGRYELTSGHHRVEALKRSKGKDYEVNVTMVDYNDEQMLIDMVRENLTQRNTDFHDTSESIVLARAWLQSGVSNVKQFNRTQLSKRGREGEGRPQEEDSYRSVAKFLSKNGKTISYVTVKNYLDINDNLDKDIQDKIKKFKGGEDTNVAVTVTQALALSKIEDKQEQRDLLEAMRKSKDDIGGRPQYLLSKYKEAPDEIKNQVRRGELDLQDVEMATIESQIDKNNEGKHTEFIPHFETRLRDFGYNVTKLEQQVAIFSKVFGNNNFYSKYKRLGTKERGILDNSIYDIRKRIKKCYDEVEFFISKMEDKKLIGVKK